MTSTTWWAPGRVNLIGEHTDYSGGLVLPFAIQQGTRVRASVRDDGLLRCTSTRFPDDVLARPMAELAPGGREPAGLGWATYVAGCMWAVATEGIQLPGGVDVAIDGDLPVGAGLSSSASLVCATLGALLEVGGVAWDRQRMAHAARRVENDYVGAPVGAMDPMVVMHATARHALFIDTRSLAFSHVPLDLSAAGVRLLVVDTGRAHATSGQAYAERVSQCEEAARRLGVPTLRDIDDLDRLAALDDHLLRARARHVVTENARVVQAARLLRAGQVRAVGPLLLASHASLRDDYAVSTPELDAVVEATRSAGALGARLTGAGFGGSALVLVDEALAAPVADAAARALSHTPVSPSGSAAATSTGVTSSPRVLPITPADGAHPLPRVSGGAL